MPVTRVLAALAMWVLLSSPSTAQQAVRVGVATVGAPFSFHDDSTNTDQGLMVDLINEIGKTGSLKVQLQPVVFSSLVSSLTNGKVDIIVGTLAVTAERKGEMSFSHTVYTDSDALILPKADPAKYTSYDDLKGKVLGLQKGVVLLQALHTDLFPKIRIYDGGPDVMRALAAGEVDVGVANRSIAGYLLKKGDFPTLQLASSFKPTTFGDIAFGLRKGDPGLLNTVDAALAKIEAAGTLNAVLEKWGVR